MSTELILPWDWIGDYGTGQFPITLTQIAWLDKHDWTREQYMQEVARRKERDKR